VKFIITYPLLVPPVPPSFHGNSISMECITDVLAADPFYMSAEEGGDDEGSLGPNLFFKRRTPLFPPSPMTDEGICACETEEDTDSNFSSPDLVTPPPVAHDLKFSQALAPGVIGSTSDRHTWDSKKFALVSKLGKQAVDSQLKPSSREVEPEGEEEEEEDGDNVPAVGPLRKRSRARGSKVLVMALALSMQVKDWAQILARYQMLSLGCSDTIASRDNLRALIHNYPLNSDSVNYKLSHDREPSH